MRRRFELDPLLYTILAATALLPVVSCGGSSTEDPGDQGTGGIGSVPLGVCDNPIRNDASGWESCSGFAHRVEAGSCDPYVPRSQAFNGCNEVECAASMPYGHCWSDRSGGIAVTYSCIPGCIQDSDCASGEICLCEAPVGRCIPADCTVDADCGPNAFCSTYVGPNTPACGFYVSGAACQKTGDACTGADCNCAMVGGDRKCVEGLGGCGRPFLVDGAARHAFAEPRRDWASPVAPTHLTELSASVRARLAEHWALAGLLEHASIAAFARFSLELLALGAPPELVRDATRAMADETEHANVCFGLASAYGAPVGPGPLPVGDCLSAPTLESVAVTVLLEGCIGETVAAAEAGELARRVSDPVVAEALELIQRDETRHAALAYRFLRWALARGNPALGRLVRETFARELEKAHAAMSPESDDSDLLALGLPTASFRAALRRDVLERVVRPCLEGLLAGEQAEHVS